MISKLAYVHPDAKLGENVTVEPFAYVAADVEIGDGTVIAPNAVILDGARIGKGCMIHSGAVIAGIPQDLKFKGEKTYAYIGDNTSVRESATVNRGTASKGHTTVGNNCLIMAYAHVAHDCVVGDHVILANNVSLAGEVVVEDWAILGGHTAVHQFCRLGEHVMTGGGALISKDIPPYVLVGHLIAEYKGLNTVGLKRRGFDRETIDHIQEIYRILMTEGRNVSQACETIRTEVKDSPYKDKILGFIAASERGIVR